MMAPGQNGMPPKLGIISAIRQRMKGGPVKKIPEQLYLVGEKGPEKYVPKKGIPEMIGVNGPEVRAFPKDGNIIPNHHLTGKAQEAMEARMGPLKRRAMGGDVRGTRLGQTADDFYRTQDLNAGLAGLAQKNLEASGVGLGGLKVIPHSWEHAATPGATSTAIDWAGGGLTGGAAPTRADWDKPGMISMIREQAQRGGLSPSQAASMMASLNAGLSPEDVSKSGSAFWSLNHGQKPDIADPLTNFVKNTPTPAPLEPMGPPVPFDLKDRQVSAKVAGAERNEAEAQHAKEVQRMADIRDSPILGGAKAATQNFLERAGSLAGTANPLLSSGQRQKMRDVYFNSLDDNPRSRVSLGPESKEDRLKRIQGDPLFQGYLKRRAAQKN